MIKKINSSDSTEWTNFQGSPYFVANPACGGGGEAVMPVAEMYFEGCEFTVQQTDALGNDVQIVKCLPGNMDFHGCEITPCAGSGITVTNVPGDMSFQGAEQTPGHAVINSPGDMDFEGVSQTPGHAVVNTPGDLSFEGLSFPTLQGLTVKIPNIPGNLAFEGLEFTPYNFSFAIFSFSITNQPGDMAFEGVAMTPAHAAVNAPGDLAMEGLTLTPAHGVINTPGNIDFEGIEQRVMFMVPESIQKKKFYLCQLTGSADGKNDVYLRISNISIRIRNGEPTYCGVTVPAVSQNEDYINDRPNGQIVIYRGYEYTDGTQNVAEIVRVDLGDIAFDQGPKSSSFSLSGHATESYHYPVTIDVRPIQAFSLQANGARRIRSQTDFFLRPGDRVVYGESGEYFTAGMISITVGKNLDRMEVTEDAA